MAGQLRMQPVLNLILVALSVLLAISGPLWVIIRRLTHHDPQAVAVPEYLSEPPSDVPPGIVGTLLDERADMTDILGTLIDLARRGFIAIEQEENQGLLGIFGHSFDFVFHRTEKSTSVHQTVGSDFVDLHPAAILNAMSDYQRGMRSTEVESDTGLHHYERILLDGLFQWGDMTRLSELRNRFYTVIPVIKSSLYREVVSEGYFTESPEITRGRWG